MGKTGYKNCFWLQATCSGVILGKLECEIGIALQYENIFKFYSNNIEDKIKENPYIEDVKVHRKIPNTIEIDVKERVAEYSVDYMEKYAYINTQGYILEIAEDNKKMPIIQGISTSEEEVIPGKRLNNDDLNKLEDVIKILDSANENGLDGKVTSIDISNKNEYSICLSDRA